MIFDITRASNYTPTQKPHEKAKYNKKKKKWWIDINTLEELTNLDPNGIIINPKDEYNPRPRIMIYDDYIE